MKLLPLFEDINKKELVIKYLTGKKFTTSEPSIDDPDDYLQSVLFKVEKLDFHKRGDLIHPPLYMKCVKDTFEVHMTIIDVFHEYQGRRYRVEPQRWNDTYSIQTMTSSIIEDHLQKLIITYFRWDCRMVPYMNYDQ